MLCTRLARFGFEVHVAANGARMWQQLLLRAIDPVVLDLPEGAAPSAATR
ncbi:MAG: hypothetical protein H7306_02790 [Bacteriovorax sp.]|nr:hypothetical protein [Rhizobacter sp.]